MWGDAYRRRETNHRSTQHANGVGSEVNKHWGSTVVMNVMPLQRENSASSCRTEKSKEALSPTGVMRKRYKNDFEITIW